MIGGDSKFVLTCTHTRVPAHTHTHTHTHIPTLPKKRETRQMGVGIRKKTLLHHLVVSSTFPPVLTHTRLVAVPNQICSTMLKAKQRNHTTKRELEA